MVATVSKGLKCVVLMVWMVSSPTWMDIGRAKEREAAACWSATSSVDERDSAATLS